jgi:S-adenosyl-L-methionine hydrolase (adenosine-forming)
MMNSHRVALITDFGSHDPFVGVMKGVISQIAPGCELIDITHAIPPGDILRTAIYLWQSVPYFPEETIFLAVVDPGVGSNRRSIVASQGKRFFIGPDNGLFSFVLTQPDAIHELSNPAYFTRGIPSQTFHGRDVFAPAAAYLCAGVPIAEFGPLVPELITIPPPFLQRTSSASIAGEILFADHFGNLLTTIGMLQSVDGDLVFKSWLDAESPLEKITSPVQLRLPGGKVYPIVDYFSEIPDRACAGLVGSSGLIEIAANRARAVDLLGLKSGDRIELVPQNIPR